MPIPTWNEVAGRFNRNSIRKRPDRKRPEVSREKKLEFVLQKWARLPECQNEFMPNLDFLIEESRKLEDALISDHPALANQKGFTRALILIRDDFMKWSGQV